MLSHSLTINQSYCKIKNEIKQIEEALSEENDTERLSKLEYLKNVKSYELEQICLMQVTQEQMDFKSVIKKTIDSGIEGLLIFLITRKDEIKQRLKIIKKLGFEDPENIDGYVNKSNQNKKYFLNLIKAKEDIYIDFIKAAIDNTEHKLDYDWVMNDSYPTDLPFAKCCEATYSCPDTIRRVINNHIIDAPLHTLVDILKNWKSFSMFTIERTEE
jgi:hypothetical protein